MSFKIGDLARQLGTKLGIGKSAARRAVVDPKLAALAQDYQVIFFTDFACQHDIAGKRVLEIGSDNALAVAQMFVANGARNVVATNFFDHFGPIDPASGIEKFIGDAARADPETLGTFDIIFGIAVLEHVPDYPILVAALERLLAPAGVAYLHGDPLWTSPRGHHVWCCKGDATDYGFEAKYRFNDPAHNPIPDWAHLTKTPAEMEAFLTAEGLPAAEAQEVVSFVYGLNPADIGNSSNRKSVVGVEDCFPKDVFDVSVNAWDCGLPENEYSALARQQYSEKELRTNGLVVTLRKLHG